MPRPYTTLFLLSSVDGKISTGDSDILDFDKDLLSVNGVKEGLHQYYDIEKTTDVFSFNTGRVFAKIGFNDKTDIPDEIPVTMVVVDNKPHLKESGLVYLSKKFKKTIIVTTNKKHPVFSLKEPRVESIVYDDEINFENLFDRLGEEYGAERITIQSGGTLNADLLRRGVVDRVLLVFAPVLVGGKDTSSIMDGESFHKVEDLDKLVTLELTQSTPLNNSYLLLEYKVKKDA